MVSVKREVYEAVLEKLAADPAATHFGKVPLSGQYAQRYSEVMPVSKTHGVTDIPIKRSPLRTAAKGALGTGLVGAGMGAISGLAHGGPGALREVGRRAAIGGAIGGGVGGLIGGAGQMHRQGRRKALESQLVGKPIEKGRAQKMLAGHALKEIEGGTPLGFKATPKGATLGDTALESGDPRVQASAIQRGDMPNSALEWVAADEQYPSDVRWKAKQILAQRAGEDIGGYGARRAPHPKGQSKAASVQPGRALRMMGG